MRKFWPVLILFCFAGICLGGWLWWFGPVIREGRQSRRQIQSLQSRDDYPQLAQACLKLKHTVTHHEEIALTDERVPPAIRQLSPAYILAGSNYLTVEFHGGMDHYGYQLEPSATDSRLWTFSFYSNKGAKALTTITNE